MSPEHSGGLGKTVLDVLFFRNPMSEPLLYFLMMLLVIGGIAAFAALRRSGPAGVVGRYAERVMPAYPYLLMMGGLTLIIGLEAAVEERVTQWLGWDFTPLVFAIEGRAVEHFQVALSASPVGPLLDVVIVLVYTWGFFLLSMVPFLFLAFTGRIGSLRRLTFTLLGIWAVGLVFYLFFPVWEAWVTASPPYGYVPRLRNILLESSPALADATIYRVNLNNNFPSLHTGVSTGVVLALWYAREKWLFRIGAPVAAGVVLATVYLGIHWFVDVVAGLALAWGAARVVHARELARTGSASAVSVASVPAGRGGSARDAAAVGVVAGAGAEPVEEE